MNKLCIGVVLVLMTANLGFAQECTTLGVTDCRKSDPKSNTCYIWECKQTGSAKQMIFTGQTCTCPARSERDRTAGEKMFSRLNHSRYSR